MKTILTLYLCLAIGYCCFSEFTGEKRVSEDSVYAGSQTVETMDSIQMDQAGLFDDLSTFKCVLDTLNSAGDSLVHSEYFLYDITGDGNPELWVKSGACEADIALWVYSAVNNNVRKIFSGYGGHTDFFLNGKTIGSVTCNTGSGYVTIYNYKNGKIKVKNAKFSMWNDEGEARAVKKKEQSVIEIWENSDSDIDFKYLK